MNNFCFRQFVVPLVLLFFGWTVSSLEASHFRGGSIDAQVGADQKLTVTVYAAWRSSFIGGVSVDIYADGDANRNNSLLTMTQTNVGVSQVADEFPGGEQFTVRKHVFEADISGLAPGFYYARWKSRARVSGIVNVGQTWWALESRFDFRNPGIKSGAPTMIPATVDMIGIGLDWTQNLAAADPDGGAVSFEFIRGSSNPDWGVNNLITGMTVDSYGQLLIPAADTTNMLNERRYAYKIRVTDASGAYSERDVLMVARNTNGNLSPVLSNIGDQFIGAGNNLVIPVSATDPNASDNLTLRLVSTPVGASMPTVQGNVSINSTFSWTPAQPPGIYRATIEVYDMEPSMGTTLIDSETFTIIVNGSNQFPILNAIGNRNISVGGNLTFSLSATDAETVAANLVYSASFLPPGAIFDSSTATFSWVPTVGQLGNWSGLFFRVTDDDFAVPLYDEESITISVGNNVSPVIVPISNRVIQLGDSISQSVSATDAGGDTVSLSLTSFPTGATLTATSGSTATGTINWTPAAVGTYSITLLAQDNNSSMLSQSTTFTVQVINNVAPNVPVLSSPINLISTSDSTPNLAFTTSDNNGHDLKYQLQLSSDASFATVLLDYSSSFEAQGAKSFTIGQLPGSGNYISGSAGQTLTHGLYYWKVKAIDPFGLESSYSGAGNFAVNHSPSAPTITSPQSGEFLGLSPTFQFSLSDPDGDQMGYRIQVSKDSGFATLELDQTIAASTVNNISAVHGPLSSGAYYWRVQAIDIYNASSAFSLANSGAIAFTSDQAPSSASNLNFSTIVHSGNVVHQQPSFSFDITDPDPNDNLSYRIQILSSGSNVIDYTSAFGGRGTSTFSVGQSAAGGVYQVGSMGQVLSDGVYTWRVLVTDVYGLTSGWVSGNALVKNTAPVVSLTYPLISGNAYFRPTSSTNFQFSIADAENMNVNVYLKNSSGTILSSMSNLSSTGLSTGSYVFVSDNLGTSGNYTWSVNVTDSYGSTTSANSFDTGFEVNAAPSTPTFPLSPNPLFGLGDFLGLNIAYLSTEHPPKSNGNQPTLYFSYSDSDSSLNRLQVQISSDNTFVSPNVDYLTGTQGYPLTETGGGFYEAGMKVVVGQAPGTGTYSTGGASQILPGGLYYFRARAYDQYGSGEWMSSNVFLVNQSPDQPTGLSPQSGANINNQTPTLFFSINDPDNDPLRYVVTIKDNSGANVIEYVSGVESSGNKSFAVGTGGVGSFATTYDSNGFASTSAFYRTGSVSTLPRINGDGYSWEVKVYDQWEAVGTQSTALESGGFAFNTNLDPYAPSNLSPQSGLTTTDTTPTFSFQLNDPNVGQTMRYQLEVSTDPLFGSLAANVISGVLPQGTTSHTLGSALSKGSYYWRVKALDSSIGVSSYTNAAGGGVAFIVNQRPNDPIPVYPINDVGYDISKTTPSLQFVISDNDGDPVGYRVQVSQSANFMPLEIDYRSAIPSANALALGGNAYFTIGQAVETASGTGNTSGVYYTGGEGQSLVPSSLYYWRVQAIDSHLDVNSGNVTIDGNTEHYILARSYGLNAFRTTTGPTVNLLSPTGNLRVDPGVIPFSFTVDDPENEQVNYLLSVQADGSSANVATATGATVVNEGSLSANVNLTTQGYYHWTLQGLDAYGVYGAAANTQSSNSIGFRVNQLPSTPVLQTVGSANVTLETQPNLSALISDPDGDVLTYEIDIDDQSDFSSPLLSYVEQTSLVSGTTFTWNWKTSSNTQFSVGGNSLSLATGNYHWRVRARDSYGDASAYGSSVFRVNRVPLAPALLSPVSGVSLASSTPTFSFQGSDPDLDAVRYQISISSNGQLSSPLVVYQSNLITQSFGGSNTMSFTLGQTATDAQYLVGGSSTVLSHGAYDWSVALVDVYGFSSGNTVSSGQYAFAINDAPQAPSITSPQNSAIVRSQQPNLAFSVLDPNADAVDYTIVIDDDSDFSSPLMTYSGKATSGSSVNFQVGQVAGVGSYLVGAVGDVLPIGDYHWKVTCVDQYGLSSPETTAGTSASGYAFRVNLLPTAPVLLSHISGGAVTTKNPVLSFSLSDPEGDVMKAIIDVGTDPTFASVSFSAQLDSLSSGTVNFNVGQAATYLSGSATALLQGNYYWRVRAFDAQDGTNGITSTANGGAVAFTLDTQTVASALAEITPLGAIQSTSTNYTLSTMATLDARSTGFDRLMLTLPSGFSAAANPVNSVVINGSTTTVTSVNTANVVTVSLPSLLTSSANISFSLNVNNPSITTSGTFALQLDHSVHSEVFSATAGDANGLGDGGQLSVQVLPLGPVLSSFSEVLPASLVQATETDIAIAIHAVMDSRTSGVSGLQLNFPTDLTLLSFTELRKDGVALGVTHALTTNSLVITLPSLQSTTAKYVVKMKVRAPLAASVGVVSGELFNATDTVRSPLVSGDGDVGGDGGTLTLTTAPSGPVLSASAEVLPRVVTKGTSGSNLSLWVKVQQDASTSGVDQLQFAMPSELTVSSFDEIRFAGSPLGFVSSSSGNLWTIKLNNKVRLSGSFEMVMKVTSASTIGASAIAAVSVADTSFSSSAQALVGDGDGDFNDGTLLVFRLSQGPASELYSEVKPDQLIINSTEQVTLSNKVTILPADSGFNVFHFALPETIVGANILSVQWNGVSISHSSMIHIHHGQSYGFYINLTNKVTSNGVLDVIMSLDTSGTIAQETIYETKLAETASGMTGMSNTLTGIKYGSAGDGDGDGVTGTLALTTKAAGPASIVNAEVLPRTVTKGKLQAFKIFADLKMDQRHLGINALSWTWPTAMTGVSLSDVRLNGSSLALSNTMYGSSNVAIQFPRITRSQVMEMSFTATMDSNIQTLNLTPPQFGSVDGTLASDMFSAANVMSSTEGDGDGQADGGRLILQLLPSGPVQTVFAELQPNVAVKSSLSTFRYHYALGIDASSSGVDTLDLNLPLGYSQGQIITVQKDGVSVPYTDLSSVANGEVQFKVLLRDKVQSDAIVTMVFQALTPSTSRSDVLGFASIDDSSYSSPRVIFLGDGDGKSDGGSLDLNIVSKALVLDAQSEVQPIRLTQSSGANLIFYHHLTMDEQTSGFDGLSFAWPANYGNASINSVKFRGSSLAHTPSFSADRFNISLNSAQTVSGVLSVEVAANVPSYEITETFSAPTFSNATENLSMTSREGDGDNFDDGGSLRVTSVAVGPALDLLAEVSPNRMSLGVSQTELELDLKILKDASTSDITKIEIQLPVGYASPVHRQLTLNGTTVAGNMTLSSNVMTWSFAEPLSFSLGSGVESVALKWNFLVNIPSVESTEPLQPIRVIDAQGRDLYAREGSTGAQFDRPSSWQLAVRAVGAGKDAVGEVAPFRVQQGVSTRMTLHSTVLHDSTSLPVRRWVVQMPTTFNDIVVQTVQLDGSSVAHTSNINDREVEILFASPMSATGRLDLVFDATPTVLGQETLGSVLWNRWQEPIASDNLFTVMRDGDGDGGLGLGKNNLSLDVVSASQSLWVESEISPGAVAIGEKYTFTQSLQFHAADHSSAVKGIQLDLPSTYTQLNFKSLRWQGSTLNVTNLSTAQKMDLSLNSPISGSGIFSVDFESTSPSVKSVEAFSLGQIQLVDGTNIPWLEGDGDGLGEQGRNSWSVQSLTNPPLSAAVAEVTPNQGVKGQVTNFTHLIRMDNSTGRSGVSEIQLEWPVSFTAGSVSALRLDGQSLGFTTSTNGLVTSIFPSQTLSTNAILEVTMGATPLLGYGREFLKAPVLVGASGESMTAVSGDADAKSSTPSNSLLVEQIEAGPVEFIRSEVTPLVVKNSRTQILHHHSYIRLGKSPQFTGFDVAELVLPSTYASGRVTSVKVDGSSVKFSDQSSSSLLKIQLTQGLWSDAVVAKEHILTITFEATTPSTRLLESFSNLKVYSSLLPNKVSKTIEGDGDLGIMLALGDRYSVQSQESIPVSKFEVEVYPQQSLISKSDQAFDVYAQLDILPGDSGVRYLELDLPESLALRTKSLLVNDTVVGEDLSSGNQIKYGFNPPIRFDAVVKLSLRVDTGASVLEDQFSRFRVISETGAVKEASEGDGDGGRYGINSNLWSYALLSSALASRVESKVSPNAISIASLQTFRYFAQIEFSNGDLGFDQILLGIPAEINSLEFDGIFMQPGALLSQATTGLADTYRVTTSSNQLNGVQFKTRYGDLYLNKASSALGSQSGFRVQLPQVYSSNCLLELRFKGLVNQETTRPMEFTQFELKHSSHPSLSQKALSGLSMDWQMNAVVSRSILEATAEVTPKVVAVSGSSTPNRQTFSYFIKTESGTGFDRLQLDIPVTFSNLSFVQLKSYASVNGAGTVLDLNTNPTVNGTTMIIDLNTALVQSLLELQFSAEAPLNSGFERFSLLKLSHKTSSPNPVQITAGETGFMVSKAVDPLLVEILPVGVVDTMVAEVSPQQVTTPILDQEFKYQVDLKFNALSTGVDYFQLDLPNEFINAQLLGVFVDGSRVLFEDQSTPISQNVGGGLGGALAFRLPSALVADSKIEIRFKSSFRPQSNTVQLSSFWASRYPLEDHAPIFATEGNGGDATTDSWSVSFSGPASGTRPLSDFPLLLSNSGDFAQPLMVGYGFPGGRVQVLDSTNALLAQGNVDVLGFFALRLPLLSTGNHLLQTQIVDQQGNALGAGLGNRHHLVGPLNTLVGYNVDMDGDGIWDLDDADADNDQLLDVFDGSISFTPINIDPNGPDSDSDGVLDAVDPVDDQLHSITDSDADGIPDAYDTDDDADGIMDIYDAHPYDTDNDGIANVDDSDDDNDGVLDTVELGYGSSPFNRDSNGDGIVDLGNGRDSDGDGLVDDIDPSLDLNTNVAAITDVDGDGLLDTQDPDWDNDGVENSKDVFPFDADNDGINDLLDDDDDNDGIVDSLDVVSNTLSPVNLSRDTDNDGLPNSVDPDDDGDGILDHLEIGFQWDANQDGNVDGLGFSVYHGDRDGLLKSLEDQIFTDYRNADSDGDGNRDDGTPVAALVGTDDRDLDGLVNTYDAYAYDADNDGLGDANDSDDDGDGRLDNTENFPNDSDDDGVANAQELDMDNDGLLNIFERALATDLYRDSESLYLKPDAAHFNGEAVPNWLNGLSYNIDWSPFSGDSRDVNVPSTFDSSNYLLPIVPVWSVSTLVDDHQRPEGYEGPLLGQLDLKLNSIARGKMGSITLPLTDFLIQQKRKLLFKVFALNDAQQWEEVPHTSSQSGRWLTIGVGPHRSLKIYYQDKGFTVSAAENSGGGGCLLR